MIFNATARWRPFYTIDTYQSELNIYSEFSPRDSKRLFGIRAFQIEFKCGRMSVV